MGKNEREVRACLITIYDNVSLFYFTHCLPKQSFQILFLLVILKNKSECISMVYIEAYFHLLRQSRGKGTRILFSEVSNLSEEI